MYTDTTGIDIEAHINRLALPGISPDNSLLLILDQSGLFIVSKSRSSGVQWRKERPVGVTSGSTKFTQNWPNATGDFQRSVSRHWIPISCEPDTLRLSIAPEHL